MLATQWTRNWNNEQGEKQVIHNFEFMCRQQVGVFVSKHKLNVSKSICLSLLSLDITSLTDIRIDNNPLGWNIVKFFSKLSNWVSHKTLNAILIDQLR